MPCLLKIPKVSERGLSTRIRLRIQCVLEPLSLIIFFSISRIAAFSLIAALKILSPFLPPPPPTKPGTSEPSVPGVGELSYGLAFGLLAPAFAVGEAAGPVPALVGKSYGRVLELGPGTGNQVPRYDRTKAESVVGVEKDARLRGELGKVVARTGWALREEGIEGIEGEREANGELVGSGGQRSGRKGEYTIVGGSLEEWLAARVEQIERARKVGASAEVERLQFDTVLSCQVLCSVDDPLRVCSEFYKVLKPGGTCIVMEHVARHPGESVVADFIRDAFEIVWPRIIGNCHLSRRTQDYLERAGEWESVELQRMGDDIPWMLFPRVYGTMIKAR